MQPVISDVLANDFLESLGKYQIGAIEAAYRNPQDIYFTVQELT